MTKPIDFTSVSFDDLAAKRGDSPEVSGSGNLDRFLNMLGKAEGAGYNTVVGGGSFDSYDDHPRIVGLRTKDGPSTAAGKYQITKSTYDDFAPKLGITDFSPASQDRIARAIIEKEGALGDIEAGDFDSAIGKLGKRWASLPSSPYGQPRRSADWIKMNLGESTKKETPQQEFSRSWKGLSGDSAIAAMGEEARDPIVTGGADYLNPPKIEETKGIQYGKELSAAIDSWQSNLWAIPAAMGSDYALKAMTENKDAAEAQWAESGAPQSFKEMEFGKNFGEYFAHMAIQSAPYMAEFMASGFGIGSVAKKALTTTAANVAEKAALEAVKHGAQPAAAKLAGEQAAKVFSAKVATAAGVTGSYPSAVGDVLSNQYEESKEFNLPAAAALGVPYAAMNAVGGEGMLLRAATRGLPKSAITKEGIAGFAGRAGVTGLEAAALEGSSETGQEVMNQLGRMTVNPNATLTDQRALDAYEESFIAGGLLGGAGGAAAGGFRTPEQRAAALAEAAKPKADSPLTNSVIQTAVAGAEQKIAIQDQTQQSVALIAARDQVSQKIAAIQDVVSRRGETPEAVAALNALLKQQAEINTQLDALRSTPRNDMSASDNVARIRQLLDTGKYEDSILAEKLIKEAKAASLNQQSQLAEEESQSYEPSDVIQQQHAKQAELQSLINEEKNNQAKKIKDTWMDQHIARATQGPAAGFADMVEYEKFLKSELDHLAQTRAEAVVTNDAAKANEAQQKEVELQRIAQDIESGQQKETAQKRDAVLKDALANVQPGQNPLRAFDRALKAAGFTDTTFTEQEKEKIARWSAFNSIPQEELDRFSAEHSAPNELIVPERKEPVKQEPKQSFAHIDAAIARKFKFNGKALTNPKTGKTRLLKADELAYYNDRIANPQAAPVQKEAPVAQPKQEAPVESKPAEEPKQAEPVPVVQDIADAPLPSEPVWTDTAPKEKKPLSQWTAEEIQARLDKGELSKESEDKLKSELALRKPAKEHKHVDHGLSVGVSPAAAEPIAVRNGIVYIGDYPAEDFNDAEPIKVADNATPQQIVDALKKGEVLAKGQKIFGLKKNLDEIKTKYKAEAAKPAEEPKKAEAAPEPVKEAPKTEQVVSTDTTSVDDELQDALSHLGDVLGDVFGAKLNITGKQHGASDLLPAMSKVIELLVKKGFKSFREAIGAATKAMRGNEKTSGFVDQVTPRQWKAAYNSVAEFYEGTESEDEVAQYSAELISKIISLPAKIEAAEAATDTNPTEAQKEAGNYAKGKVAWNGLTISIETPKGAERTGKDASGKEWSVTMPASYGYFLKTVGADEEHLDVFIGPNPDSGNVFVVNQDKVNGDDFDEHKVLIGFDTQEEAKAAYFASFTNGFAPRVFSSITEALTIDEFKAALPELEKAQEFNGKPDSEKSIPELQKELESAKFGKRMELNTLLIDLVTKDADDSINRGEMPVYKTGEDNFIALHPSAQKDGMIQATRYSNRGVFGDSQYNDVREAIRDNALWFKPRMSEADATKAMSDSLAAEAAYQRQKEIDAINKKRRTIIASEDSLFMAIARLGGLDTNELLSNGFDKNDITVESAGKVSKKTGKLGKRSRKPLYMGYNLPLHKQGGISFDGVLESLKQYGYFPEDATKDDAIEAFRKELGGEPVYTPEAIEKQIEEGQAAFDAAMAEEQSSIDAENYEYDLALEEEGYNELFSYEAVALADSVIAGDISEAQSEAEGMRALGFTEEEINEELARTRSKGSVEGAQESVPDRVESEKTDGRLPAEERSGEGKQESVTPASLYQKGDRVVPNIDILNGSIVEYDGKLWMAQVKRGDTVPLFPFVDGFAEVNADTLRRVSLIRDNKPVIHTGTNYYGHGGQPKPTAELTLSGQTNEQAADQFAKENAPDPQAISRAQADKERDAVPFSLSMESQPKPMGVQGGLFGFDGRVSADAVANKPEAAKPVVGGGDLFGGLSPAEVSREQDSIEALREKLRKVETSIFLAADSKLGIGGGDIEEAMRSRKVPTELKQQRLEIRDKIRELQKRLDEESNAQPDQEERKIGSQSKQSSLEAYLADSPEDRNKLNVVIEVRQDDGNTLSGPRYSHIESAVNNGYTVVLTGSGPALVNSKMQGWNKDDLSPAGMRYANWLISNKPAAENKLPEGWTEATAGGMATNTDPKTGGIVDKTYATGEWFFIPENDAVEKQEGFKTRQEAFDALAKAVKAAEEDYASTSEQVEIAKELMADLRFGIAPNESDRDTIASVLKIYSLKGFDRSTAHRLMLIADVPKSIIDKILKMNPVPADIDYLAESIAPLSKDKAKKLEDEKLFRSAKSLAENDEKLKELLHIYDIENSNLDSIAAERGRYGVKWAEENVGHRWNTQAQKVRKYKGQIIDAVRKLSDSAKYAAKVAEIKSKQAERAIVPLSEITVTLKARVEDSNEMAEYDEKADVALKEIDNKMNLARSLIQCLAS